MFKKLLIATSLICTAEAVQIEKIWESKPHLKVPESVILDSKRDILYAANINGKPLDKDSNGFISILGLNGEIKNLKFSEGFNAPKGMAIHNDKLYVSDIDTLKVVMLRNGNILNYYKIKNAKFLNDVAVSKDGTIFVSDYSEGNKAVYKIKKHKVEKWLDSKDLQNQRPNGLWIQGNDLVVGTKNGTIFKVNMKNKESEIFTKNIGVNGIDGILAFDDNSYITSDWAGRVFVSDRNKSIKVLDNTKDKISAADIWYDSKSKKLYIPTFFDNRILCYEIK
jgi:sugar lactone lactonase YvrE